MSISNLEKDSDSDAVLTLGGLVREVALEPSRGGVDRLRREYVRAGFAPWNEVESAIEIGLEMRRNRNAICPARVAGEEGKNGMSIQSPPSTSMIPSSWRLQEMIRSAERRFGADREQALLREEARREERYVRSVMAEVEGRRLRQRLTGVIG